jgi:hypothetical protein
VTGTRRAIGIRRVCGELRLMAVFATFAEGLGTAALLGRERISSDDANDSGRCVNSARNADEGAPAVLRGGQPGMR